MRLTLHQVDAFTNKRFHGNPAAICPLDKWLPDETMQSIAEENNLAETAFYVKTGDRYHIRWFTPGVEIDLCGHATLATAYVILEIKEVNPAVKSRVVFDSKSGELIVDRDGDLFTLDFPARPPKVCEANTAIEAALGDKPAEILAARDYLCVFESEEQVRALKPNMQAVAALDKFAVIVTAPGGSSNDSCDFVSRFFAPAKGVPEDPVTGSAHCTLVPYWSKRLGKTKLHARQISKRGGELWCEHAGDRVKMAGNAVEYMEGQIETDS